MRLDTIEQESTDLDLHVVLCAQRYAELDKRLTSVETKLDVLNKKFDESRSDIIKVMIATMGTTIASVMGVVILILTKLP
jgi:tetrahydromethanopterin S-methyltransferase subunit G